MIIFALLLSAVAFAFTFVFAKKSWQTVLALLFGAVFVASLVLTTMNFAQHFGMKKVAETKDVELVSSADVEGLELLLYKPLGDGTEKVYLYQTPESKKPQPTATDNVVNQIKSGAAQAVLTTESTYWEYENDFYRFLFGIVNNEHELIATTNTFHLPDTWEVLSVKQVEQFGKLAKARQASMKEEAQTYIQEQLLLAMSEDPLLAFDEAKQQELIQQWTAEFQADALQQLRDEVKK